MLRPSTCPGMYKAQFSGGRPAKGRAETWPRSVRTHSSSIPPDYLAGRVGPESRTWPQGTRPHQVLRLGRSEGKMAQVRSYTLKSSEIPKEIK